MKRLLIVPRGVRNGWTAASDRAQGGFGQAQSEFVQYQKEGGTMNYGQWLKTWKETCTNAPGTTGKNTATTTETTPPK